MKAVGRRELARRSVSWCCGICVVAAMALGSPAPVSASSGKSESKAAPAKPKTPASSTSSRSAPAKPPVSAGKPVPARPAGNAKSASAGHKPSNTAGAQRPKPQTSSVAPKAAAAPAPSRPSIGQAIGLHEVSDPLSLHSSVALAMDARTGEVLFEKNSNAVLPIASISKLMTAMVVLDASQPLGERLSISTEDIDTEKFTRSRLRPGTMLSRDEMLQLALMSSENRAANALGRHYPGGLQAFVAAMNAKARQLDMQNTYFVEPTGLSSSNVSSAVDLARLVRAASDYPLIREYSTASSLTVVAGQHRASFHNTNRLVSRQDWEIALQKTGYISEAGNCLVMQARLEDRPVVMVLLDAVGRLSRYGDAQRLRSWIEGSPRPMRERQAVAQASTGS